MEAHVDTHLGLLTQPQAQLTLKQNKKNMELPENLTIWKFDNQKFLEATLIQIDRRQRCGARSQGGEDTVWHREAVAVEWANPHSSVVNKNWEGHLGNE